MKNKYKYISYIILASGILLLIIGVLLPFIALQNYISYNGAISIIGGADIPTYEVIVFGWMNGLPFCLMLLGAALSISALFCLLFSKTVKANCTIKTSALSIGLSAVGAMGITCVFIWFTIVSFHEMSKHPISYPLSKILGMLCFFAFIVLIALYFKERKNHWTVKGFFIDIFTSILYLPAFFFTLGYLF